jgi:hypothetical protein
MTYRDEVLKLCPTAEAHQVGLGSLTGWAIWAHPTQERHGIGSGKTQKDAWENALSRMAVGEFALKPVGNDFADLVRKANQIHEKEKKK